MAGFFCDGGSCTIKRGNGSTCSAALQCASGFCVGGVCCNSQCSTLCYGCSVAASVGTCTPLPSGTTCAAAGCTGGVQSDSSTCNGMGTCMPSAPKACAPYLCGSTTCLSSCTANAQCQSGFECQGGRCQSPDLALYWKLDEDSGITAVDSSGFGRNGTYLGAIGLPAPSSAVPPVSFSNARSRAFVRANQQAISLGGAPAAIKPSTGPLTVSVWFKSTSTDNGAEDVVGLGDDYFLRLKTGAIEWIKRVATTSPLYALCSFANTNHLDGKWHHLVGVNGPTGMRSYLDGAERCSNSRTEPIIYMRTELVVGRSTGSAVYFFEGNIDDVRIYTRALSAAEILILTNGSP